MRAPQPGDAARGRVAVGARIADRLDQLVDDRPRRRAVRVAHAEVDDVVAGGARRRLHRVDLAEDVGRQAPDAVELGLPHRAFLLVVCQRDSPAGRRSADAVAASSARGRPGEDQARLVAGRVGGERHLADRPRWRRAAPGRARPRGRGRAPAPATSASPSIRITAPCALAVASTCSSCAPTPGGRARRSGLRTGPGPRARRRAGSRCHRLAGGRWSRARCRPLARRIVVADRDAVRADRDAGAARFRRRGCRDGGFRLLDQLLGGLALVRRRAVLRRHARPQHRRRVVGRWHLDRRVGAALLFAQSRRFPRPLGTRRRRRVRGRLRGLDFGLSEKAAEPVEQPGRFLRPRAGLDGAGVGRTRPRPGRAPARRRSRPAYRRRTGPPNRPPSSSSKEGAGASGSPPASRARPARSARPAPPRRPPSGGVGGGGRLLSPAAIAHHLVGVAGVLAVGDQPVDDRAALLRRRSSAAAAAARCAGWGTRGSPRRRPSAARRDRRGRRRPQPVNALATGQCDKATRRARVAARARAATNRSAGRVRRAVRRHRQIVYKVRRAQPERRPARFGPADQGPCRGSACSHGRDPTYR